MALIALIAFQATAECPERPAIPDHIRPQSCQLATDVASGLARSMTFRAVVDRINELNGAVFIQPGALVQPTENRTLNGALLHRMTIVGGRRALFIVVRPNRDDDTLATLAHEFQHAIEVLQSDASTESQMDVLFQRIGVSIGTTTQETGQAILVGHRVAQELARNKSHQRPGGW